MHTTKSVSTHTIQIVLILLCITVSSFVMNGFSHVSRFLNVGLYVNPIAAKIDPTLFRHSLHVQSVEEKNTRLSLMHDLSPYIFRTIDLEKFAIAQWIICLFLTAVLLFYLGKTVIGTDIAGYGTALLFSAKLNEWTLGSPAIYINFFHHGIQWAIMLNIFSLIFLFKKRYPLALLLMGIAFNFHPMSVAFLFLLLFPYWVVHRKEWGFKKLALCGLAFALPALPLMVKALNYLAIHWEYGPEWMTVVKWTTWYTVFPSTWPLSYFFRTGLFLWLFIMGLYALPAREKKRDIILFVVTIGMLCVVGTIFAEVYPIPFVMKLSLWRTSWLYIILSLPCIIHLFISTWDNSLLKRFLIVATMILLTGYIHSFPFYYLLLFNLFFLFFSHKTSLARRWQWADKNLHLIFITLLIILMAYQGLFDRGLKVTAIGLGCTFLFLVFLKVIERSIPLLNGVRSFILPALFFIVVLDGGVLSYKGGPDIYYHGYVQGKRDQWADIQSFAKAHTHKDALFIVPPYINDFGIYSERATLGDWAEGASSLYMDNDYAKKWLERMNDLGWKTMRGAYTGYNSLTTEEIVATARKYNAVYIVTEKQKRFDLPMVYENSKFILYNIPELEQEVKFNLT